MKKLTENLEAFQMSNMETNIESTEATKVVASRVQKEKVQLTPKEEIQQKISKQLMDVYNSAIVDKVEPALFEFMPENHWIQNYIGETKSVTKDSTKYKEISLDKSYYQVKYEYGRYRIEKFEQQVSIADLIGLFEKSLGKPSAKSKKKFQYNSLAYRQMWYFKNDNTALVIRTVWRNNNEDDQNWGIVTQGGYVQVTIFLYYTILEEDLKQFLENVPVSEQIIEKLFNVAGQDSNYIINLPIQTISLATRKIPKKFKEYNKLFKLPNASIISLKFVDDRNVIENFVEKATGIRECPDTLPKWYQQPEGVCYDSNGNCPDYFNGEIPDARGKLKDNDVWNYQFRIGTEKEFNAIDRDKGEMGYAIQREENGPTFYLIKVPPKRTPWEEHINKMFWTDFENSFAFYYNNEGTLQKVNLEGYQDISNFDIVRLYDSGLADTQINLGVAMIQGGREAKWWDTNPEDAAKFAEMCYDLLRNLKQYSNLTGIDFQEEFREAQQRRVVSSHVIHEYMKSHPDFKELFVKFFSQVGATDQLIKCGENVGNRDAVALAKMIENGIDFDATVAEIKKLEDEHLEIARDPKANTPLLPKNIKNFNSDVSLFAQQAIAVSMANNQKTAILDVDMGGGKTCMMVADICNQLTKGVAHKPLIVCPNKTLVQNKKEIFEKWTDKRMNVFILNTQTYNLITNRGKEKEKLAEVMNKMPPNTIFMTSYNFLVKDHYKVPLEELRDKSGDLSGFKYIERYPIPKILIQDVGIDMIYCDESQYIKNSQSGMSNAVAALSGASIKRITSGTIIPNNPIDLFAQLRFVDPSILGSKDAFLKRYAEKSDDYGKITKWKDGAQKQIREQIERKGGVSIRRSMWRWLMPHLHEEVHFVELTEPQAKMYEFLLTMAIEEIMSDPKLKAAFDYLKNHQDESDEAEDDEETEISEEQAEKALKQGKLGELLEKAGQNPNAKILGILSTVTGYLAAPNTNILIQTFEDMKEDSELKANEFASLKDKINSLSFSEEDLIGPKIFKMKEIITKHFEGHKTWQEVGKIIVFTERIAVAEHAYAYMGEWQKHTVWYKAGMDSELEKFKTDNDIWIIIACDKSIKEGQNLQMASRIIRLDIPWTPGDINQSYARAYRTGQKKDVAVDIILCNGSMEICKYNNLISKEYTARKIISSFDEGDDRDFEPVKMNINNMQSIKWKEDCGPYITMHNRINEQELEESREFGEKYKDYFASGVSKVGSRDDIPGSELVYVPETLEERIMVDDEGRVITTKTGRTKRKGLAYEIDEIGTPLKELEEKYEQQNDEEGDDEEYKDDNRVEEEKGDDSTQESKEADKKAEKDKGLHLYFLQCDEDLYLFTFYNKSSKFLRSLKFNLDNEIYYGKPINNVQDIQVLETKLKKQGFKTNLGQYVKDNTVKKLASKKIPGALTRLKKHNAIVMAAKELDFWISKIEGQLFLLTYDKVEGFVKINKGYYYDCKNKARTDIILNKIAKEAEITNLDELAEDYKKRFGSKLNIEKLEKEMNKSAKPAKETKPEAEKKPASSKYNGKQIVLGLMLHAKSEKHLNAAYKLWISKDVGGLDFNKLLEKKGVENVRQSVKYLLDNNNKTTEKIIDWFNSNRKSVVVRFLNSYKKSAGVTFDALESFVKLISK